jgi:putative thioredoxin
VTLEVTEASFVPDVLERSKTVPVVVDFWAGWCGPCRSLTPILERLAEEADGQWILAKVDVDSNPGLARTFGIQGIPAVKAFKDGHEVAEFVGAMPEPQVRQWLAGLGPSDSEIALLDAQEAEKRGDKAAARAAYRRALEDDPTLIDARRALARLDLEDRVAGIDPTETRTRVDADPNDVDAVLDLADLEMAAGHVEEAFLALLNAIRHTSGDERNRVRVRLLELFNTLGAEDPRAIAARRELSLALY